MKIKKFVDGTKEITSIINPNVINAYAAWEKNIDIPVTKAWENTEDSEKVDVIIKLLGDKVETGKSITIAKDSDGKGKFEDIEVFKYTEKDGKYQSVEIEYSVLENPIEGFDTSYAGDKTGFTVTNSKKVVEFNITHEFVSGTDGKVLPKEVTDLIPEAFKAKKGDTVTPKDFTTKEIKVDDGTWTFTKWDKDSAVVESDIEFIGTWTFKENPVTPVEFDITHEFVSEQIQASQTFLQIIGHMKAFYELNNWIG